MTLLTSNRKRLQHEPLEGTALAVSKLNLSGPCPPSVAKQNVNCRLLLPER